MLGVMLGCREVSAIVQDYTTLNRELMCCFPAHICQSIMVFELVSISCFLVTIDHITCNRSRSYLSKLCTSLRKLEYGTLPPSIGVLWSLLSLHCICIGPVSVECIRAFSLPTSLPCVVCFAMYHSALPTVVVCDVFRMCIY